MNYEVRRASWQMTDTIRILNDTFLSHVVAKTFIGLKDPFRTSRHMSSIPQRNFGEATNSSSLKKCASIENNSNAKKDMQAFINVFPDIVQDLTKDAEYNDIREIIEWYEKILQYNLADGKKKRGLALVKAYRILSASEPSDENLKLANILGWCVEMLQAFYLVHDDLIDDAEMRRNRPCWFRINNNGLNAINDGVILENGIYVILKRRFKDKPYYVHLMETFHDVTMKTTMGQILDSRISTQFRLSRKLDIFNKDVHKTICKYKTAYYSFKLPVAIAMHMAGISDDRRHKLATNVLLQIGNYFQIQDDYIDCFGDKNVIGKSGNDIQEGKCTWPLVMALERASALQKNKLYECYGCTDPLKVETVKKMYKEIGIEKIFEEYEKEAYNSLVFQIKQLPEDLPQEVFLKILKENYKRKH